MADSSATPKFAMSGVREVLAAEAVHMERQIIALERAVTENPGLAFDLAKTLIESACKTILSDRGCEYNSNWDLPRLLKETLAKLRLVPSGCQNEADVTISLRKTIGGLQTTIQVLCELRNTHGFASHGRDAYSAQLDVVQAQLAARAADVVVSFLFRAHYYYPGTEVAKRLSFSELEDFNSWIDDQNPPVRIFSLEYRPSEVLFSVDLEAYRDLLLDYRQEEASDTDTEQISADNGIKD